jgi:autoinducer 2-binding protein LuxP
MRKIINIILFSILGISLYAQESKYFQIEEYLEKYNQKAMSANFNNLVQNEPIEIKKSNKKIKIMMVYPGNQISDYWRKSKLSFEKRLDELGIEYELKDFFTKPAIEIRAQSKQLLKATKDGTDYLIFTLDANKHKKFIERIIAKEKPKLILQNITTPIKEWADKQAFIYVGFDHFTGTKLLADEYIQKTNGKGNYAVLYGPKGYVSDMRGTKFVEYVSKKSDLKVIHEYYTDFNKAKAKKATLDLLSINKDIKFIYACSTDIAFGVIDALKEKNLLGKIIVNGWGGGNSELDAIEESKLDLTVMRMNDDNGVAMAEAIKLDLEGLNNKVPTIYSGEFELVEKGIDKTILEEYKSRAFRYTNE